MEEAAVEEAKHREKLTNDVTQYDPLSTPSPGNGGEGETEYPQKSRNTV